MHAQAAWGLARVFGPALIAVVFLGLWLAKAREVATQRSVVARVTDERDELIAVITEATVAPDKSGRRVPLSARDALAAQRALIRDRDSKGAALATVKRTTTASVATDVAARQTRVVAQVRNEVARRRVAPAIRKLETTVATGDVRDDAAALETASRAAWEAGK